MDLAADTLRDAIARGDLGRGERLRFSDLIVRLGVSATPIREALRVLETEGLVSLDNHRQVRVTDFTIADAKEVYELRAVLEGLATEHATQSLKEGELKELERLLVRMKETVRAQDLSLLREANATWHQTIYVAGGLKYLPFLIQKLWVTFPWDTMWVLPGRAERSLREHREILGAIKAQRSTRAGRLMKLHILGSQRSLIQYLQHGQEKVTTEIG